VGCDSNAGLIGDLSGSVTYKEHKLSYGTVVFYSLEGRKNDSALARGLIVNGEYHVDRVPVGPVKIVIVSHPRVPEGMANPPGNGKPNSPRQEYVPIPGKYGHPATTTLKYNVEKGSHTHDIVLPR
jgi:hypothetical protein